MNNKQRKTFDDFFNKNTINLKQFLSSYDFEVLKKLNIKVRCKKCSEFELGLIKGKMEEYYDIRWLYFKKDRSERLKDLEEKVKFEKELFEEGLINEVSKIKNLYDTGVKREQYEKTFEKIEILMQAVRIYKRLKKVEKQLPRKPTLLMTYRLLKLDRNAEE